MGLKKRCQECDLNKEASSLTTKNEYSLCIDCIKIHDERENVKSSRQRVSISNEDPVLCNCVNNNVLSYIQCYMKRSAADNMKAVITRFYGPAEINQAKLLLWQCNSDALRPIPNRVTSSTRTAKGADANAIIAAFQKLEVNL